MIPNSGAVTAEGLTCNPDIMHFDTPSLRIFGERYAERILELGK